MVKRRNSVSSIWGMAVILTMLIAGCQTQNADPELIGTGASSPGAIDYISKPKPTNSVNPPTETHTKDEPETKRKDPLNISAQEEVSEGDETTADESVENKEPNTTSGSNEQGKQGSSAFGSFEPYTADSPKLMGISLGDKRETVINRYGSPMQEYVMTDNIESFTILEYSGFLFGVNSNQRIEFIDVTSTQANPGLNGLKIGDNRTVAIAVLGTPDNQTEYVLNYKPLDVVMKLDLDPANSSIVSIKLFRQ